MCRRKKETPQGGLRWFLWRDVMGGGLDTLLNGRVGDALAHMMGLSDVPKESSSPTGGLHEPTDPTPE